MASKDDTIAELRELVQQLTKRIEELELQLAKAQKDSSNSSKSPSSDIVKPPKKKADRRKKVKRGGQNGHPRTLREPLPPERVDEEITYKIDDREVERLGLTPTGNVQSFQHIELLEMPIYVTETRLLEYADDDGNLFLPDAPGLYSVPIFGPRMLAMIGWLKSRAHCSYTTIEAWMDDILQVPVSRGYLAKLCTGVISESLADSHEELKAAIPQQSQLGSDETSIKNEGKKHWIWCITAASFTLFHIAALPVDNPGTVTIGVTTENSEDTETMGWNGTILRTIVLPCESAKNSTNNAFNLTAFPIHGFKKTAAVFFANTKTSSVNQIRLLLVQ